MKTIILLSLPSLISLMSLNGAAVFFTDSDKYCAKMMDGRLVVMHDGTIMLTEVRLANGTELKPDGSIISQDGKKSILKDGECIDKSGLRDPSAEETRNQNSK